MVIFNSYVSLPEGKPNPSQGLDLLYQVQVTTQSQHPQSFKTLCNWKTCGASCPVEVFAVARWKAQGQKMSQIQKKDLPP